MTKSGIKMKTGDIVKIEGGFFKADNGTFLVKHALGDPSWSGSDYCLTKCNKKGIESESKYSTAFWPLMVTISSREKSILARQHNKEHATIEIIGSVKVYELNLKQSRGWNDYESREIATEKRYQELLADKYTKVEIISESTNEPNKEPAKVEEVTTIEYKFKIGDKVNWKNSNGVNLGERTIIGLDVRSNRPTYYIDPIDTPWFSVGEEELTTIIIEDSKKSIKLVTERHGETPEIIAEDPYKQENIEEGYIYNMHFKTWDKTIEEIETELNKKEIPFTNMGDKVGCYNLNFEQAKEVKTISDINGSICFIDFKTPCESPTEQEQPEVPNEFIQASKRQLYALYLGTKIKTTDLVISKDKAGELIAKSIKGIDIFEELQAFINGEDFITEVSEPLQEFEEIKQEEEIKIMDSFDDILSKFDEIEVKNSSRISLDDQTFCEDQEKGYNEFIKFSNDYLNYLSENSLYNIFYNSESLVNEMNKTREVKKDIFISKVVNYFRDKYRVTLESEPIQKKYDISLKYDIIIDEIMEQLGGYNFIDKTEKEIKDEFKNTLRYDKVKLKNKKLSIEGFFQLDYFSIKYGTYEVGYGSNEKFIKLFKAISHFLCGSNENLFSNLYSTITRQKNDDVFKTHDVNPDIIKALKLYKNGKIDIEFSNAEHMREFAKEYCGYIGIAAK